MAPRASDKSNTYKTYIVNCNGHIQVFNNAKSDVILRTVQKKGAKIKTERTIIEVKKVIYPE